jgi:ankyrin repeat protein
MNLDQLRRQAKELRDAARRGEADALQRITAAAPGFGEPVALSLAQLVIARENGHSSWPALKAAADNSGADLDRFLDVSLNGPAHAALAMLRDHPRLADNQYAAAVLGDTERATTNPGDVDARGWSPLLYACYSRWHTFDPSRTVGLTTTVARLLEAGANPNSHNGRLPGQGYQSALHGAVVTDKTQIVELLLDRGAPVDDRSSLPGAAELRHHRCLELLLEHGATVQRTWALGAAVFARDGWAVRRLLEAVAAAGGDAAREASEQLEDAARDGATAVVEALLEFGADPTGRPEVVREAVRAGATEAATLLEQRAGADAVTVIDRLIGACMRGDRAEVQRLAAEAGDLTAGLSVDDAAFLVHAAGRAPTVSIELLLSAGWPVGSRDDLGETALHNAAYQGNVETVRLLLDHGGAVDARDERFDSTPLTFATVGSRERQNDADTAGDWIATVRTLIDAGATRDGVWLSGDKAPSDEIAELLRSYGVRPEAAEEQPETRSGDKLGQAELALGGLEEIAALLRLAFETTDMDLFGSLLATDVRWGGGPLGCNSREQVIAQYRQSTDLGFRGSISAAEAHGDDTLIIELRYAGAAEGMPKGPVGTRAQALRIVDDLIVSIEGYPDIASARQAQESAPDVTR